MRILFVVAIFFGMIVDSFCQEKYSKVRIDLTKIDLIEVAKLGLEVDHGSIVEGVHFINVFSEKEINLLYQNAIPFYIEIEDMSAYIKNRKNVSSTRSDANCLGGLKTYDYKTPDNYSYGSMGGYLTFSELLVELDSMAMLYPELITAREPIGQFKTWDGNEIYWLKLSDNAQVDEDEPEVLFTALHHAREPNSLSQMIFYLWYLLENYESDPNVKFLVDNTELYFVPCINPDGYIYNETTDPNGGGFWRKNRRPESKTAHVGVDLNRNYGFFWGYDDAGSSPEKTSNTYRGPEAFSEPETQAIRDFSIDHEFVIAQNYHTKGNLLIHPWGYNDQVTSEDEAFKMLGNSMIKENDFKMGTGTQTVGYVVNGYSDDYQYGEQGEKGKTYSYTPEVGEQFWPDSTDIDYLNRSCMHLNLTTGLLVHNYYDAEIIDLPLIVEQKSGTLNLEIRKPGLKSGNAVITLVPHNPDYLSFSKSEFPVSLANFTTTSEIVNFSVSSNTPPIHELGFDIVINNGETILKTPYNFKYRNVDKEVTFSDEIGSTANFLTADGSWGLTDMTFVSAPYSLTDSPNEDYLPDAFNVAQIGNPIDLTEANLAFLKFNAWWVLEPNFDYVMVQASTDKETWTSLCGKYTKFGRNSHGTNDPLLDGFQVNWVEEEMSLSDFIGSEVYIRFVMVSDDEIELEGIFIDDIHVEIQNEITSVENVSPNDYFMLIPTASNGKYEVNVNQQMDAPKLKVIDISGKTILSVNLTDNHYNLDITNAPEGFYFVTLISGDKTTTKKIVKN